LFWGGNLDMSDSDSIPAIEALAANVTGTQYENLDTATIELAKNRIIDVLGCIIGGANAPDNKELTDLVRQSGGQRESTVMIFGQRIPTEHAAMVNAVMVRSYDFEVMAYVLEGKFFPSHHAATTVPTALALAEALGAGGKELLTAMIVGDDVAARVQAASAGHPINLGWDGCTTLSHLAAVATSSRLLGLNTKQTKNAFGIAVSLIGGTLQCYWDGAPTFKLGQGTAAMHGIFAARLAKRGWSGLYDPLFSRYGYFNVYGGGCIDPGILTRDLGKKFYGEAYFKPYPCGMPTHAGIDAALTLMGQNNFHVDEIEEVVIHVPYGQTANFYYAKPFVIRDFPQGDAAFSYIYTVATALVNKSVGLQNFTEEAIRDPRIKSIIEKIKMVERPEGAELGIQVDLRLTNGRQFSEYKSEPRDWATKPTPRGQIIAKFLQQVAFSKTISRKKAESVLELLQDLERLESVGKLLKFMVA
jgi:2-methylcitrate dehydratase